MIRDLFIVFVVFFTAVTGFSQEETSAETSRDSIKVKADTLVVKGEKKVQNPLAPSKAAFYSAVLPGLGQIYNKRYWKLPIVYGAMATTIYFYIDNNNELDRYRDAYKRRVAGFTDDEFSNPDGTPFVTTERLQDAQDTFRRNRDLSALLTLGIYVLNIVDANVDAHLKQYNIDNDLSFKVKPYLNNDPFNNQVHYGLSLNLDF